MLDRATYKTKWKIRKYADDAAFAAGMVLEEVDIDGNILLNEGITEFLNLLGGISGTAFSNANARLGVGDSSTAEGATQTGLQAATNKTFKPMEPGYPQVSGQTITWRAVFGSTDANYAWNEFTCTNGADDTAKNINRKVSAQGTKANGQTWTLDLSITWS